MKLYSLWTVLCSAPMPYNYHSTFCFWVWLFYFKILFTYFWRWGWGGRKREREKHWTVAGCTCPNQDPGPQPGMCPDQESSRGPFPLPDDGSASWARVILSELTILDNIKMEMQCLSYDLLISCSIMSSRTMRVAVYDRISPFQWLTFHCVCIIHVC